MRDIYETYNSKYCYPGTTVLKNKLNIMNIEKLQTYEAKITAAKSLGLRKKGITGDFDVKHIKQIHKYLFAKAEFGYNSKVLLNCSIDLFIFSFHHKDKYHIHLFK